MTTQSNSTVNQDLILAARRGLVPVKDHALGGFSNMLRKELGQWWSTRTWWVQVLIWVLLFNGVTSIVALSEYGTPAERLQEVVMTFLSMMVAMVGIGTVITAQGAVVSEKELGTAAWIMSKPASRSAFILAKIAAYMIGFWITAILIPATIFFVEMQLIFPAQINWALFLEGLSLAVLSQLFYLVLTVMLGAFFSNRGPIAGIGIALIMTGLLLKSLIPMEVMIFTPWPLGDVSGGLALGSPLPSVWWVPIATTTVWIIVMAIAALRRFGREEF
jgi:ABC-2 type transport system permease protein